MQFLYRGHPEIGMRLKLPIKPRGSGLLSSDAQEIGACVTSEAVKVFSVLVMTVAVITVARFDWPFPTHGQIFSILDLKSKPEHGIPDASGPSASDVA